MSENAFTPALGRFAPTRFYDHMVALTRERLWRLWPPCTWRRGPMM
jgi:hypothetical protein